MHVPVMPRECSELVVRNPEGRYVDLTCGLGGHTALFAGLLRGAGRVLACDRDPESLEKARANIVESNPALLERIQFVHGRFSQLRESLRAAGWEQVDGLLADLGVSMYQLTTPERGFSLRYAGPLDMRMDRSEELTAADIVNLWSERDIANLIWEFGEEGGSRKLARAIVRGRPIRTTDQLAKLIEGLLPRTSKISPATRTFQALRMAVNREPEELDALLELIPDVVNPGGRAAIISFMSLDDRKVKQAFQKYVRDARAVLVTKKPLTASEDEVGQNPASRSAKLRVLELTSAGSLRV